DANVASACCFAASSVLMRNSRSTSAMSSRRRSRSASTSGLSSLNHPDIASASPTTAQNERPNAASTSASVAPSGGSACPSDRLPPAPAPPTNLACLTSGAQPPNPVGHVGQFGPIDGLPHRGAADAAERPVQGAGGVLGGHAASLSSS